MIDIKNFFEPLVEMGYNYFTGVPCSFFKSAINYAMDSPDTEFYMASNEGAAMGMAAGAYLAGGKAVVMLQNSGLGNTVNPLTSLNEIYNIPAMVLVSGRGFEVEDEPQHNVMGAKMIGLIESLGFAYAIIPEDEKDWRPALEKAEAYVNEKKQPFLWIARKGCLSKYGSNENINDYPLTRFEAVTTLAELIEKDYPESPIFASTGMISRELFRGHDTHRNFYMMGSMGHISAAGLGFAQKRPELPTFVFDGDGSLIMHTGTMSVIGHYQPANLYHILLDNHAHQSTGNQRTTSETTNFSGVAREMGYTRTFDARDKSELEAKFKEMVGGKGPAFLRVFVNSIPLDHTPRITEKYEAHENTENFLKALRPKDA